jgi:hypothetical protein
MAPSSYFRPELLPPAQASYERELGSLGRPNSRGWSLTRCPFHRSKSGKSFSVNVQTGAFHCFGCDSRGGDLIDFLRKRHGYDFKTAAKILGAWREDLTCEERRQFEDRTAKVRYEREQAAKGIETERTQRLELRDEIHTVVKIQAEISARLSELLQGAAPAYENEVEDCWSSMSMLVDDLRDCETRYMSMIGIEYAA